jgi:hypothetical protein
VSNARSVAQLIRRIPCGPRDPDYAWT